ncbi:hypothetical protein [Ponticaulis koreensis]|uniref:hypothetical protein n=1 Tax=Ponticaulis koreensis TaxID=1123045 RepID=UPI0003B4B068|nr:hypothetical protein [Ponticaulis koreensis]
MLHLKDKIKNRYEADGHSLGWRFFTSTLASSKSPNIALITLNPGGSQDDLINPSFCRESGSAYFDESWEGKPVGQSALQIQVQRLFKALAADPRDVLSGHLVPFRSPSWEQLKGQREQLAFGLELWTEVLERTSPALVICIGGEVFRSVKAIYGFGHESCTPAGWGEVKIRFAERAAARLVGLPHLSRFQIIGRERSEPGLSEAFGRFWKPHI